jgi:deoxyadenosine/deoxycytidine kinase
MERIQKRARSGETIESDYIERCHSYHETWIRTKNCPLLELEANEDMNKTTTVMLDRMERITEFIKNLMLSASASTSTSL